MDFIYVQLYVSTPHFTSARFYFSVSVVSRIVDDSS